MTTRILTEAITAMMTIFAEDDYSQQALVITPGEARQLRDQLNAADLSDDPAKEREAANLRRLTLYNGHSLPSIERPIYEQDNQLIGPLFKFELWQVFSNGDRQKITEL